MTPISAHVWGRDERWLVLCVSFPFYLPAACSSCSPTLIPFPPLPHKNSGVRTGSWSVSPCSTVVCLSLSALSACCAATGAKLPFDLESSNQLSQWRSRGRERRLQITFCAWPSPLLSGRAFIWCGREERESGRCLVGNEFDSRQSTLSAFSPLILIVGSPRPRLIPLLLSCLPFCAVVVVPGHGNSQIYIFDALFFDTFFELCERDFAAPHVQVLYLLVLFHFAANADVTLLYFDC